MISLISIFNRASKFIVLRWGAAIFRRVPNRSVMIRFLRTAMPIEVGEVKGRFQTYWIRRMGDGRGVNDEYVGRCRLS